MLTGEYLWQHFTPLLPALPLLRIRIQAGHTTHSCTHLGCKLVLLSGFTLHSVPSGHNVRMHTPRAHDVYDCTGR